MWVTGSVAFASFAKFLRGDARSRETDKILDGLSVERTLASEAILTLTVNHVAVREILSQ